MPHDAGVLRQVAELHVACLDQGFLSSLGPAVLACLYRAIDDGPESVLIVETRDGQVVGFISGGAGMGPVLRRMLRRPVALLVALAPLVLRPGRLAGIVEILRHGRGEQGGDDLPRHELLSLAVTPQARGSGVAGRLYAALVAHFRAEGCVASFRIVVGDTLTPAHRFYRRMGARLAARTEVHAGRGSVVYVQEVG